MNRRLSAASALVLLAPSIAHAAYGVISYTDVADTFAGSPYKQVGAFPSINNAGQTAFTTLTQSNIEQILLSPVGPGPLINIADTSATFSDVIRPTVNNNGIVAFGGTDYAGHHGIYNGNGATITTVADSSTSSQPYFSGGTAQVNEAGSTLFLGYGSSGFQQFIIGKAGVFTTVVQNNGGQFEALNDAALNNSNQVAFNTDDYTATGHSNNGSFVYRYTNGTLLTIGRAVPSTVAINDAGVVAYQAAGTDGSSHPSLGIFATDGVTSTPISIAGQPLPGLPGVTLDGYGANGEGTPINSSGMVALLGDNKAHTAFGIYVGDGTYTTTLAYLGQSLFGKTVNGFELGKDAINDAGQVTFSVSFTDGTSAIVRSSGTLPVPEPASLSLLTLATTALAARRRR